ncbi:uncharacterized protein ACWYII_043994 isoform 2-T2 [Salvelinus alpinus]
MRGFQMDASKRKVLAPKGSKKNCIQALGTRDRVSVLACFNAAGEDVPPFIIFGKRFPGELYTKEGPANALYGTSPSGYIDNELFRGWFVNNFIKYAVKTHPLLLVFEGHKSHLDPEVIEAARKENVVLLVLPPNSSHILQPLDLTYFSALKTGFFKVAGDLCHFKNSVVISKMDFPMVLHQPYQQCKERKIVVSGFRKAGIFPFNPSAIDWSKIVPLTSKKQQPQKTATPSSPTPSAPPPAVTPSKYMSHPLVAAGLNNPELAEVFTEIDNQKKTRPKKMKTSLKARVITEEEYEREMKLESARKRDIKTPSPRRTTPRCRREPPTSPATSPSEGETASPAD